MTSLISRGQKTMAAIALSAAALFAGAVSADDAQSVDKVANAHKMADCTVNSVKEQFKKTMEAVVADPDSTLVAADPTAQMTAMQQGFRVCASEVSGVALDQVPALPEITQELASNPTEEGMANLQKESEPFLNFVDQYVDQSTLDQLMEQRTPEIIQSMMEELTKAMEAAAARDKAATPAPAPQM